MLSYSVELRVHTEDGEDYSENHYDFDTKREAIEFADKNQGDLHSVIEYKNDEFERYIL